MLSKKVYPETTQTFIERVVSYADEAEAEYVHFNRMQHYLVVRICRGSWTRIIWRGPRSEAITVLSHLKTMSGMDAALSRVLQSGHFPLERSEEEVKLPAI